MKKILLVDDHPSVMEGTKIMLEKDHDNIVTLCCSGKEAIELAVAQSFDIMLFDLNMPEMSGIELTRKVLGLLPDSIIIIYTGYDIAPHFNMLIEAGVTGFISKTLTEEQLLNAVRCAARKEAIIPLPLLQELRRVSPSPQAVTERSSGTVMLSDKDKAILFEVAKGKSNREIAEELFVSQRSLEYCLTQLFQKLGVRSRVEAVMKSRQLGLLVG
ncbi:response regulator transcription factor [Paenibacillus alkalitolerans]|uniref:response regulator transcription factor n=1 Tax=Paenibacillus alkalitolerans TaxID=2799335 RepID=UPI0018F33C72|nr:response regulator transcription factor [Paenibacillus alkalitolerans]